MHLCNCLHKVHLANGVDGSRKLSSSVSACVIITSMKVVIVFANFSVFLHVGRLTQKVVDDL